MNTQQLHQTRLATWASLIQEQQSSGLTIREWCVQKEVSFHAYNYWKNKIKKEYVSSMIPEIVPLNVDNTCLPKAQPSSQCTSLKSGESPDYDEKSYTLSPCSSPESGESRESRHSQFITITAGDVHIELGPSVNTELLISIIKAVRYA